MAGKKLTRHTRIKASSILEVVVAMVIIVIAFGIALTIYANVLRSSLSVRKIRAQHTLEQMLGQDSVSLQPGSRTYQENDLIIVQKNETYHDIQDLILVSLEAFDENKVSLAVSRKIFTSDQ